MEETAVRLRGLCQHLDDHPFSGGLCGGGRLARSGQGIRGSGSRLQPAPAHVHSRSAVADAVGPAGQPGNTGAAEQDLLRGGVPPRLWWW